jgi:hypothetical protein
MPYHHRTEFPQQYRNPWDEPRYEMPDGSGPWTIIAWADIDEPAARSAQRHRVEVTSAPDNRSEHFDSEAEAQTKLNILNFMVEQYDEARYDESSMTAIREATVDGFVDGFDVVLREGAVEVQ